jgi:hypothetical protein
MKRRMSVRCLLLLGGVALLSLPARGFAQLSPGEFSVTPNVGWDAFADASALRGAPSLGLDVLYQLGRIGVGGTFSVARPETRGNYFAPARHTFPDTTFLFSVSQQVTQVNAGALVRLGLELAPIDIFADLGVGRYAIFTDPEVMRGNDSFSGLSLTVGAAAAYWSGRRTGVQVGVRDVIFTGFDRDRLNAVNELYQDHQWPDLRTDIPEKVETLHNLRLSIGVIFVPGL